MVKVMAKKASLLADYCQEVMILGERNRKLPERRQMGLNKLDHEHVCFLQWTHIEALTSRRRRRARSELGMSCCFSLFT